MNFENPAIPPLDPKGDVYKTQGPTDFAFHARPVGTVKAVMVFVDFSDCEAGAASALGVANSLLGKGRAQALYHDQSYQQLTLEVTVRADLGWRRMPHPTEQYCFQEFDSHKAYLADAVNLFTPAEVCFSDYTFVFVAAPRDSGSFRTAAFNAYPGSGAPSPSGEVRLAVTFAADSYATGYIDVVHEAGHLFGLPDLYPYSTGSANDSLAGCWDIMSDIFHASGFLGWHRHKNGWLGSSRKTYLARNVSGWNATLTPLSGSSGLSMVVLPIDDALNPSKVYVVELAQPVRGTDGTSWGEGVLLYTVDATIETGCSSLAIIPKITSTSPVYGHLYEALYRANDAVSHAAGTASISLKVLRKLGSAYEIRIDYRRQ